MIGLLVIYKWYYTFTRLLEDPTPKGTRRANYTKNTGVHKSWALKPEKDWIFHEVPPIISEELWDECNAILTQQAGKKVKPTRKPIQLFGGNTFCHCGGKMYVNAISPGLARRPPPTKAGMEAE